MRISPAVTLSVGSASTTCLGDQRLPTYQGTASPFAASAAPRRKVRVRCPGRIGTAAYLCPFRPASLVISRASAQGWVPSALGQGTCHPPPLSLKLLVVLCIASDSRRKRSWIERGADSS